MNDKHTHHDFVDMCMQVRILVMSWVLDYEILKLTSFWCKLTSHHWSLIDRLLFLLKLLDVKFNPLWWSITFWVALFRFIISHVFLLFIKFIVELVLLKLELGNFTKEKIAILYDHKVVSSSDKKYPSTKKGNLNSSDWLIELNAWNIDYTYFSYKHHFFMWHGIKI